MKLNKKDIDKILGPIPKFTTKKYYFSNRGIRINSVGEYNCPVCGGTGRLVCDGEFCDPVEGYKMARHENCYNCFGQGYGNYVGYYNQKFKEFRAKEEQEIYYWNKRKAVIEYLADGCAFPDDILKDFFKHIH